jgi:hypothetical protein
MTDFDIDIPAFPGQATRIQTLLSPARRVTNTGATQILLAGSPFTTPGEASATLYPAGSLNLAGGHEIWAASLDGEGTVTLEPLTPAPAPSAAVTGFEPAEPAPGPVWNG